MRLPFALMLCAAAATGAAARDATPCPDVYQALLLNKDLDQIKREWNSCGRDINFSGYSSGRTLLMAAASNGRLDVVQFFLDAGADINAPVEAPDNALTWALMGPNPHPDVAKYLISRGAIFPKNKFGRTPGEMPYDEMIDIRDGRKTVSAPAAPATAAAAPAAPAVSRDEMRQIAADAARQAAQETAKAIPRPEAAPVPKAERRILSDVDAPRYHDAARPDDVALVVGVEKYNDLPDAQFAERDAKSVRDHLLALGYAPRNVILLTGAAASRAGIVKNLERRLPEMAKPDGTVFFYYSGHGAPDATNGKAYLLPADGDPQYLEDTAYPLAKLYESLGRLRSKHVLVALDSCFSGAGGRSVLARGTRPLVTKIDAGSIPANVVSLTASRSNEISGTLEEQGHGAFTYYLLKGLTNGRRSARQLYEYAKPQVEDAARLQNRAQSPTLTGTDASL